MKKLLFLLTAFTLILSCSSDETSTPVTPTPAPIVKYTITLSAGEGGTVSTTGGEYESGQTVNVTATPQGEYVFTSWSDGNTNATRTITIDSTKTLTANFEKKKYPLTVNIEGEGEVLEEIVNAGRTTDYDSGTTVKLTAVPAEGWEFVGWTGAIESKELEVQLLVSESKTVSVTFIELPAPMLSLLSSPLKMFTKTQADTLKISINTGGGFKSVELSSSWGDISTISTPTDGSLEGDLIIQYISTQVKNIDYAQTIAGSDNLLITVTDQNNLTNTSVFTLRTQPEPIFKNYLKPSHELVKTRVKINPSLIRYLNKKDNSQVDRCNYVNGGLNKFGNLSDDYGGIAFADINGDGYDDMFMHPVYSEGSAENFSSVKNEYELYVYDNGEYKYYEIDWGGMPEPKAYLARKILVGDYDNDGDPDLYSVNYGIDDGGSVTEKSFYIINNFSVNGTLSYKEEVNNEGAHSATSADIDNDGDLDVFQIGRQGNTDPYTPFLRNDGNFEFIPWSGRYRQDPMIISDDNLDKTFFDSPFQPWHFDYFRGYGTTTELYDINNDGFIDLIMGTNEWEKRFTILWGSSSGFNTSNTSIIPTPEVSASFGMGHLVDVKIQDLDNDNINEIIMLRTGGEIVDGQINNFYNGWYLQVLKLTNNNQLVDITNEIIENFYSDQVQSYCGNPSNNWIYWLEVNDYDGDGNLDIYNKMMSNRPLHRWEWSGSKFVKVSP